MEGISSRVGGHGAMADVDLDDLRDRRPGGQQRQLADEREALRDTLRIAARQLVEHRRARDQAE